MRCRTHIRAAVHLLLAATLLFARVKIIALSGTNIRSVECFLLTTLIVAAAYIVMRHRTNVRTDENLLLATLLAPISAQIDQRKISDTQNALNQITDALTGYALSKGYLPCPDKT